jgi:hypothetical protein
MQKLGEMLRKRGHKELDDLSETNATGLLRYLEGQVMATQGEAAF